MTQENKDYSYLIGKKMKAFEFDPSLCGIGMSETMRELAQREEVGKIIHAMRTRIHVRFAGAGSWSYPLHQAVEYLVEETEIPELGDGVLMEVSNYEDFNVVHKRMVFAKKGSLFYAWGKDEGHAPYGWPYARPIQHKEISKEEAEQKLAELTKEKWKIV
jgi:hypothetical protein